MDEGGAKAVSCSCVSNGTSMPASTVQRVRCHKPFKELYSFKSYVDGNEGNQVGGWSWSLGLNCSQFQGNDLITVTYLELIMLRV